MSPWIKKYFLKEIWISISSETVLNFECSFRPMKVCLAEHFRSISIQNFSLMLLFKCDWLILNRKYFKFDWRFGFSRNWTGKLLSLVRNKKKGKYFGQWPRSFKNAVAKIALKGFVESALSLIIKNLDAG